MLLIFFRQLFDYHVQFNKWHNYHKVWFLIVWGWSQGIHTLFCRTLTLNISTSLILKPCFHILLWMVYYLLYNLHVLSSGWRLPYLLTNYSRTSDVFYAWSIFLFLLGLLRCILLKREDFGLPTSQWLVFFLSFVCFDKELTFNL